MNFKILPGKKKNPVLRMVVPGPRALGVQWEEVTFRPSEDGGHIEVEKQATQAPANGMPHIIPAMGNLSSDEVDFILEGALKASEYESHRPRRQPVTDAEVEAWANKLWHDYFEQKLRAFQGISTFGLGGHTQRQSWGGPKDFNPRG